MDNKENTRPKRRKSKDNPYSLHSVRTVAGDVKYYISFKDIADNMQCVEVDKSLFDVFDRFELDDLSFLNERTNHPVISFEADYSEDSNVLSSDALPVVFQFEELFKAMEKLPEKQRNHLKQLYFEGYSIKEIAEKEGMTYQGIRYSIQSALKKLESYLNT